MWTPLRRQNQYSRIHENGARLYTNIICTAAIILTIMLYLHTSYCKRFADLERRVYDLEMQVIIINARSGIENNSSNVTLRQERDHVRAEKFELSHIVKTESKTQFQAQPGSTRLRRSAGSRQLHP